MKKILILFAIISFALVGCCPEQKTQTVTTSSSLHNYDSEMISEALKNHTDFPKLTINESAITNEVIRGENNFKVTYSWETGLNSHDSTAKADSKNKNTEISTEDTFADYSITLIKEWETVDGTVKSYWKYQYIPQTNKIELLESEDNDNKINK